MAEADSLIRLDIGSHNSGVSDLTSWVPVWNSVWSGWWISPPGLQAVSRRCDETNRSSNENE